ncbi:MAG: YfhO family protein, partial [Dehalococcoidia bacterium]|nr:YfhO family protein [Dehalococcoidia bacterium]
ILSFLLPSDQAFIWNIVLHFVFAGVFTYCLVRALGLTRLAGVLGGVSFMLSGFLVAKIHHQNLLNSAVWLPLILCFLERAARATGARRHLNLVFAGVAFGFQCLGVHVQAPLMSSLVIGLYAVYRWLLCPVAGGKPRLFVRHDDWQQGWLRRPLLEAADRLFAAARVVFGRLVLTGWTLVIVPLLAGGLAAVQLLPLWELGTFSRRAGGVNYEFATMHPQTMANLLTLIFPNFFVGPDDFYWGLWSSWETRLYVGIVPVILAVIGLIAARQRMAYFFGGLAALAIWVGMAGEAPWFNLHAWLSQFPGFNQMRAPGRYALVFSLGVAVLAAYGFSFLETHLRGRWTIRIGRLAIASRPAMQRGWLPLLIAALALILVAAIDLTLRVEELWPRLQARSPDVSQWIESYLAAPRMLRLGADRLTDDRVYAGLIDSLNPSGFDVTYTLVALFVGLGLIYLWLALPMLRRGFQAALIALVVADLMFINWQFHPLTPVTALTTPSPPVRFLQRQQEIAPGRVFSRPGAKTAPNSLMTFSLPEINGYSSLNFKAHEELIGAVDIGYGHLLDLFGARYLVTTNRFVPLPSYEATPFNPSRPIISTNSVMNAAASDSFTFEPWEASEVRIISRLRDSASIAQGTPVIELAVTDDRNQTTTFRLLAGVHTAETKLHDPAVRALAQHRPAEVAFEYKNTAGVVEGYGYYARFPLRRGSRITQIRVRNISPLGNV